LFDASSSTVAKKSRDISYIIQTTINYDVHDNGPAHMRAAYLFVLVLLPRVKEQCQ